MTNKTRPEAHTWNEHMISEVRAELGRQAKSQTWLAEQLGIPRSGIARKTNRLQLFNVNDAQAIARVLGLTCAQLLGPVDPPRGGKR